MKNKEVFNITVLKNAQKRIGLICSICGKKALLLTGYCKKHTNEHFSKKIE